jgi:hypothetical protein
MLKPDIEKPVFRLYKDAALKIKSNQCPTCSKYIVETQFKDAESVREFGISGMCQECQDSVFG